MKHITVRGVVREVRINVIVGLPRWKEYIAY